MKYTTGFRLINCLEQDGLIHRSSVATVEILKGQAIFDDGNGLATNAATVFSNLFLGVAAHALDNSPAVTGASLAIIPPRPGYKFIVPNGSGTKAAATDVGETVDLEAAGSIDVTDTTLADWGFMIDEIDISTEAVAANAAGYVIGRFAKEGDQT